MPKQQPSVGRIVHYQPNGAPEEEPIAAVVTHVASPDCVSLCLIGPSYMSFLAIVTRSDEPKPGHWNWPPRV